MKITKEHYKSMESAILSYMSKVGIEKLIEYREYVTSDMQYRWDILRASGFRVGDGVGIVGDINGDYNDNNIDTALRKIFGHEK